MLTSKVVNMEQPRADYLGRRDSADHRHHATQRPADSGLSAKAKEPVIGEAYTGGTYAAANHDWHESDAAWKARQVARMLDSHRMIPDSICDIGCGTGGVLDELGSLLNWNPALTGYEVAEDAFKHVPASRKNRIELVQGSHDADERTFDLLLCLDVFEHIEDYYGFLRSIRSKAPFAVFHIPIEHAATTAFAPAPILRSAEQVGHIQHFSPTTALEALRYSGYDVIDSFHSVPAREIRARGVRQVFGRAARMAAARINVDMAARAMTGFPLLVLCAT